jgi:hypothetical protein
MEDGLQLLLDLGFEQAGEWHLAQPGLECSLSRLAPEHNILYAFVSAGEVVYIGRSVHTLGQRMSYYKTPDLTQGRNIVNHEFIRRLLERGRAVQIYVFVPQDQLHYRSVAVNLAAGLKDALIAKVRPPWNRARLPRSR